MSRIIQSPDPGPDLGQSLDVSQGFLFLPDVTAVRGSNSIEAIATTSLNLLTLIEVVISGTLQFWQLQSGTATADTENTVAPVDNASIHWQRVGGFGVSMMAAARMTTTAAVTLANNVPQAIAFDTEEFNSGEWLVATPSRITALVDGVYSISGSVSFAANATGQRKLAVRKGGSTEVASQQVQNASASVPTNVSVSTIVKLLAGEYVELVALQSSGGNLDVLKATQYSPEFAAVRLAPFDPLTPFSGNPNPFGTPPPPTPSNYSPDITNAFSITDAGWYRIWSGAYPASGSFDIKRLANGDGQTSDTVVDFTIIAGSPEGIINISRNSVPTAGSPSIDGVRVLHNVAAALAYVDVHLLRGDEWSLRYSSADTNFLDAPYVTADVTTDATLTYGLKPNVTGGTGTIDVPQINSGGNKLLAPNTGVTWAAATGTPARTTYDTATATLTQVAQRLKAVIDDLITQGVFQAGIPASMTYTDMLALAASLVAENSVANVTDAFRVTVAPDTTVQGVYVPCGTFNGHNFYKIQGWEYETAGQNSPRQCYWSSAWTTWTISNASGNLYHSGASETNPWDVVQWKSQAPANVAVTTVAPNIALTYNALTDTHTAMVIADLIGTSGYAGLYLRGADLNAKRRYYLVGTGSNNKRIEWTGTEWDIKDDSATFAVSTDTVTYPDQATWGTVSVTGINAVDLMSGLTVGDVMSTYSGVYVPVQGVYNVGSGRKLLYRRTDGVYTISNVAGSGWRIGAFAGPYPAQSDTDGNFPWNAAWTTANLTVQQNKIASPGWNNLATQPNTNITNNVIGNWHL